MHIVYMCIYVQYNKTIYRAYAARPRLIKRKYKYLYLGGKEKSKRRCVREKK